MHTDYMQTLYYTHANTQFKPKHRLYYIYMQTHTQTYAYTIPHTYKYIHVNTHIQNHAYNTSHM